MEEVNVNQFESAKNLSDYIKGLDEYASDADLAAVPLFPNYPHPLLTFASACCIIFMIIGIPGNLITILALARCRKVRNATAIFIINLSTSDLLFCCFNLPLASSTFYHSSWTHGILLCRLFPWARYALVAVSLFTVLAITINRYVLIIHPTLYHKIYKTRFIYAMIFVLWVTAFGLLLPTFFEVWGQFSLDHLTGSCTIVSDDSHISPKKFLFVAAFALPSLAIILCYLRIWLVVRKTGKKSRGPMPMTRITDVEISSAEVPQISVTVPETTTAAPELRKDSKARLTVPCFYSPELSMSNDDSSSREDTDKKCAPEFKPSPLNSEQAKRIRQSFIATFRKSTAYIKPRLPSKKDKRLLTMIVAIITSFCVCHLPITLTKTIFESHSHPYVNIFGYLLLYMTTCINPIIYVVMSSEYRQAYKNCLRLR